MLISPLRGIIPPMITPLKDYNRLDRQGLDNLIEHLIDGGVHAIFILGTNGEAPSLDTPLKKEFIREAGALIKKRVPLLVGISDTVAARSLEIAAYAADHGAEAVVLTPPYYYPLAQEEVIDYYAMMANQLPLPFFIYDIPSHTKIPLTVDTVKKIKELGALGIKDSSGDMFHFYSLVDAFSGDPDFSLITGMEMFIPDILLNGGHGAVPGGANMFPHLFVNLYKAAIKKDFQTIAFLRQEVMEIYKNIYQIGKRIPQVTAGIKCALALMGICDEYMAPPLQKVSGEERERIAGIVNKISHNSSVSRHS